MSRELLRSFVIETKGAIAEERVRVGGASPATSRALDAGVEEDGGFLFKLRTAAGFPVRFLGLGLFFAPVVLVVKVVFHAFDARASDILIPIFAILVTLFFASVSLWIVLSFAWWIASGRKAERVLLLGPPDDDMETFEGTVAELAPGASVLFAASEHPHVHYAQMEVFAVVRDAGEPIVVVPKRFPRALGKPEPLMREWMPKEAVDLLGPSTEVPEGVVVRAGDRVRVRGLRVGDVANAESFTIEGVPAAIEMAALDGAYRRSASGPAILVGDGPTRRLVLEKLEKLER
ncbi:hypothetical protein BH09MYX1_BH09MYX1_56980 [soil metagenome]